MRILLKTSPNTTPVPYRGISQRQLEDEMGIAYSALNKLLNARCSVTEKTALLFEACCRSVACPS